MALSRIRGVLFPPERFAARVMAAEISVGKQSDRSGKLGTLWEDKDGAQGSANDGDPDFIGESNALRARGWLVYSRGFIVPVGHAADAMARGGWWE